MVERFSMNPVSCKLLNEAWEKEFPDEVAIAERMLALLDELEHYKSREERVTKLVLDNSTSWDVLYEKLEAAEKRIAEQREYYEGVIADGSKRIAELEAREISLPERSSMLYRTDFHEDYHTVMAYKVSDVIAAIRAAGIKVKGE
ncbi:ead/Ea22-like family protein [Salmonella enterica]|nr:ead/Ea22-like family protein [Salmonella enterica]EHY6041691.1 ead/Ea22-like family protein [Salmonella enterica]EIB4003884.1 ead/Ea22-like family protein [Salmonella enterica]EJV4059172.1 ead/Ea22-like family protein [Salmonella enterica]EJY9583177.1 ead/Ea22-like family protein [Salmonella enterica]